jgi:hypothetical protein
MLRGIYNRIVNKVFPLYMGNIVNKFVEKEGIPRIIVIKEHILGRYAHDDTNYRVKICDTKYKLHHCCYEGLHETAYRFMYYDGEVNMCRLCYFILRGYNLKKLLNNLKSIVFSHDSSVKWRDVAYATDEIVYEQPYDNEFMNNLMTRSLI